MEPPVSLRHPLGVWVWWAYLNIKIKKERERMGSSKPKTRNPPKGERNGFSGSLTDFYPDSISNDDKTHVLALWEELGKSTVVTIQWYNSIKRWHFYLTSKYSRLIIQILCQTNICGSNFKFCPTLGPISVCLAMIIHFGPICLAGWHPVSVTWDTLSSHENRWFE